MCMAFQTHTCSEDLTLRDYFKVSQECNCFVSSSVLLSVEFLVFGAWLSSLDLKLSLQPVKIHADLYTPIFLQRFLPESD